jgi:hypothetical protein
VDRGVWQRTLADDKETQINGQQMRAQLTDYSSLIAKRVRPYERVQQQKLVLAPPDQRLACHYLQGQRARYHTWEPPKIPMVDLPCGDGAGLSPDLEALFRQFMKPSKEFHLPIRLSRRGLLASPRSARSVF